MKILICHDGSEQAERALRMGATIAGSCNSEVTLLGIIEALGKSKDILESLQHGLGLLADRRVNAELVTRAGKPIEEIVKKTHDTQYDLVVIGAVRKDTRGAFWMSSKSYKIIKEVEPPVLLVAGKRPDLKRILICSGGKHYIDKAAALTGQIARCLGASVTVLHVLPEAPAIYAHLPRMEQDTSWLQKSQSELSRNLRSTAESLQGAGVDANVRLRHGTVLNEILREIREGDYDLVTTGSALSRGLRTYVLGDVTREIVNRSTCAVLVVRSQSKPSSLLSPLKALFKRSS